MSRVHHRYATVRGQQLFYREAGAADAPALVLLHGFPTSSFMFRDLIPPLADRYHVIAPDHLGFGAVRRPAGRRVRLHLRRPDRPHRRPARPARGQPVRDLRPGLRRARSAGGSPCAPDRDHGDHHPERQRLRRGLRGRLLGAGPGLPARTDPGHRGAPSGAALTPEAIRWQYLHGVADQTPGQPGHLDARHRAAVPARATTEIQLALFRDYATNPTLYPRLHEYLRTSRVPVLAVWGRGDEIFGPDGAHGLRTDAAGRRDPPARRRPLPAGKRRRRRRGADPGLSRPETDSPAPAGTTPREA